MTFKDDVNSPLIITVGAMSGFLVIVLVIGLQAWFLSEEQRELSGDYTAGNRELIELHKDQQAKISTYRWIDRDKNIVAIPIDDAKKLLIENKGKLPTTAPAK